MASGSSEIFVEGAPWGCKWKAQKNKIEILKLFFSFLFSFIRNEFTKNQI